MPMHAYYAKNKKKLRKQMDSYMCNMDYGLYGAPRVPLCMACAAGRRFL